MSKKISGAEYSLAKIFSSDFEYVIPSYQRPYAWTVDQASELFDDLFDFYQSESEEEGYFLGSIVLIKKESEPSAEVIDGQQRLTTLTILLSSLAYILKDQDTLRQYIQEPGNEYEGLKSKPRLTLRKQDQDFFAKYIQALEFEQLRDLDDKSLANESQINIKRNSLLFIQRIVKHWGRDEESIKGFGKFLIQRCFLVAVSTPSQQSAFRVFSVINSRGLDLQPTDIIKADLIGQITSEKEKEEYSESWENMEVELGRDGFNDLFTYVRMIYAKGKAKKHLLEEFRNHVLSVVNEPKVFISDVLQPFASALATARTANYKATSHAKEVNTYLYWLNRIDNSDWMPIAILFLSKNKHTPEYVAWFFNRLDRLAAYMHICARNVNERIERYSDVLKALEQEHSIASPVQVIELTESEKEQMCDALNGNIYELPPKRRNYLILRLDAFLSDGAASYDSSILTIEHVLPQTVTEGSEWATLWPDADEREKWLHRLANIVPLNKYRNSQAQNYDFEKKKSAYFAGKTAVSSYVLTSQVLDSPQWTPDYLAQRQEKLLKVLQEKWRLGALTSNLHFND